MSTFNYLVRELFELFQYSSHIAISVLQLFIAETNLLIPIRYTSFEILVRNRCRHIILLKRKSNNTHNIICVSLSLCLSLSLSLQSSPSLERSQWPPALADGKADVDQPMENDHDLRCVFSRVCEADTRGVVLYLGPQQQLHARGAALD